jgi:hypothetical protein
VKAALGHLACEDLVLGLAPGTTNSGVAGDGAGAGDTPVEQCPIRARSLTARAYVQKETFVLLVLVPDVAPTNDPPALQRDPEVRLDVELRVGQPVTDVAFALASAAAPLECGEELAERREILERRRPKADQLSTFSKVTPSLSTRMPARS